jgi:hypothetical protein
MKKEELAKLLAEKAEEFKAYGGEVVRYASPEKPNKIKLGAAPVLPDNLRDAEWEKYLQELYSGTYAPDTDFRLPEPKKRTPPKLPKGEDGRGWKPIKGHGPGWKDDK